MAAGEASACRRGLARLRATGPAGIAAAAVIAVATFAAAFGPLLAPYDPDRPNLSLSWAGPAGGHLLGYDVEAATSYPAGGREVQIVFQDPKHPAPARQRPAARLEPMRPAR